MSSPNGTAIAQMDSVLFGTTLVQCFICCVGFTMNGFLAYVIILNRPLRSTCCQLFILVMAIGDAIAEFTFITIPTYLTVSGRTIPLLTCFWLEAHTPYINMNMIVLLFMISLDRLFSILLPVKYKNVTLKHKRKYVCAVIGIPAFLTIFVTIYPFYFYTIANANSQVYCMPTDFMGPIGLISGLYASVFCNIGTAAIYALIWVLIKFKIVKVVQDNIDRRVLRSLYVLMLVTFFCWLPYSAFGSFILPTLQIDPFVKNVLQRLVQQLNKLAQAVNGPILYFCSGDYRNAMKKEFFLIFKIGSYSRNNGIQQSNSTILQTNSNNAQRNLQNGFSPVARSNNTFIGSNISSRLVKIG